MNKPFLPEPMMPWSGPEAPSVFSTFAAETDPRLQLDDDALFAASHNAFPIISKQKRRKDNMGLAAGAAIALVLGAVTFVALNSGRSVESATTPKTSNPNAGPMEAPVPGIALTGPAAQVMAQPAGQVAPAVDSLAAHQMAMTGLAALPGRTGQMAPAAPVVVFDGGAVPVIASDGRSGNAGSAPSPAGLLGASSGLQGMVSSDSSAVRSTRIADPASTVVQGTLIPAVLETAINSDVPGFARAVVSQDVRSFDGSQILIPRSSRLIGEYKAGVAAGQKRAYLLWTRLVRPDGVSIALASPSVGFSGEAGIGGKVDNHFLQRFGSAILLSVLGGASTALSGGATVVVSGGQSAASMAAQADGQRSPTIHVRQGEPIRVFTARDLIFSPMDTSGR